MYKQTIFKKSVLSIGCMAILLLPSCNKEPISQLSAVMKNRFAELADERPHAVHYENEYYSIERPSDWAVCEDIRDKAEGYENYEGNDKMTFRKHHVDFFNSHGLIFNIVMSSLHLDMPIDDYADLSVATKGLGDGSESQDILERWPEDEQFHYLKLLYRDSVTLSRRKAIRLVFAMADSSRNLYMHNQFVVKNDKNDVFYINYTWQDGDEHAKRLGNLIASTFILK